MTAVYERLQNCYESIRDKISIRPKIALVLGSGLGDFTKNLDGITIEYGDIPGFKTSTVQGHKGSLFFTTLFNKKLVIDIFEKKLYNRIKQKTNEYSLRHSIKKPKRKENIRWKKY